MYRKKNVEIPWDVKELYNWSCVPQTFIMMIVTNGWLNNIYDGNHQQNDRLMFIRKWWAENVQENALKKNPPKKRKFEETQLKLF